MSKQGNYISTSLNSIETYLRTQTEGTIYYVESSGTRVREIVELARKKGLSVRKTDKSGLAATAQTEGSDAIPRSILLVGKTSGANATKSRSFEEALVHWNDESPRLVLVLQEVTDPHNLGAVLRIADQFAADAVLITQRRSASVNATVSKVSSGADQFVSVYEVGNLVRGLDQLKDVGFWIYGADMGGKDAHTHDLRGKTALVLGSEGRGLGKLVESRCDALISIPTGGNIDSLNVSVAAGILAYEVRRQQGFPFRPI